MKGLRRELLLATAALLFAAVMLPEVAAVRYTVGDKMGWSQGGVNYTVWAESKKFYNGDWLFFVYDRNQMSVLEVNKTDYEKCNSNQPLHNWTTGAGRDVVPLNVTKTFYFISGNGFCLRGMKVAVLVLNPPPPPSSSPVKLLPPQPVNSPLPPSSSPVKSTSPTPSTFRSRVLLPALFGGAAAWESLLMLLL